MPRKKAVLEEEDFEVEPEIQLSPEEKEIKRLTEENELLQRNIGFYQECEKDEERAYWAIRKIFNEQLKIISKYNFEEKIEASPKDDKVYDRVKGLYEKLPDLLESLKSLQAMVEGKKDEKEKPEKPEGEEKKKVYPFWKNNRKTSPESIADVLGNTAGQHT